jgi:uncharacterized membrane protein YbaN (DUF454 family)
VLPAVLAAMLAALVLLVGLVLLGLTLLGLVLVGLVLAAALLLAAARIALTLLVGVPLLVRHRRFSERLRVLRHPSQKANAAPASFVPVPDSPED